MKSAPAIAFDLRPSRRVGLATAGIVALAALAPWLTQLPWWASAVASAIVLVVGAVALRRHAHPRFRRAAWRESGWVLVDRGHVEHAAVLDGHTHLGPLLTIGFRYGPRARFHIVLTSDNLDADTRRRLILRLARGDPADDDSATAH